MTYGRFIVIDGSEGAGKSTQVQYIRDWLTANQIDHWLTREPGGTLVGERIRQILLNPDHHIDPDAELLLIMAIRRQHLSETILPRLTQGQWVLSDRFNDATYAYQGNGRGIDHERIRSLENWAMPDIEPDLRLILQVSPDIARQRLKQRGHDKDRFEREPQHFFNAVAQGYQQRAQQASNAYLIDADTTPDRIFAQIRLYLEALL